MDLDDELPVDVDTDTSSGGDEGTEIWKWIAGAGGVVVAVYVLNWLFGILVGLMSFLLYYGAIALLVYGAYRGAKYLLSDNSSTSAAGEQVALGDVDVEAELDSDVEGELGSDLESELAGGDMETELEGIEAGGDIETELEGLEADIGASDVESEVSVDEDEELEAKFAELEKEMNE